MERKYDLNERLIDFAVMVIKLSDNLVRSNSGRYLADQLMRAGVAPSLHYGEAQGAESPKDFIHKFRILIKELRESFNAMKVIRQANLTRETSMLESALTECNELIAIFNASIKTARRNASKKK